jgi:hypothetical protein
MKPHALIPMSIQFYANSFKIFIKQRPDIQGSNSEVRFLSNY